MIDYAPLTQASHTVGKMDFIALGGLWLFVFSLLGYWVATQKHRRGMEGFALRFLFGCFGVAIELLLPNGDPQAKAVKKKRKRKGEAFSDPAFRADETVTKDNIMGAIRQGMNDEGVSPFE
jgi:hypothetical protein